MFPDEFLSSPDWDVATIGQVGTTKRGISYNGKDLADEDTGKPFINLKSFNKDGSYRASGLKHFGGVYKPQHCLTSDDLIVANTDLTPTGVVIGCAAIPPLDDFKEDLLHSHHVTRLRLAVTTVSREFICYLLQHPLYRRRMRGISTGTTVLGLDGDAFLKTSIPLPPLPEQRKIAAILSSVDEAIAATEQVIEQTRRVKEGLLQELLTRGIGHTRFKQTPIGEIPESWEVKRLGTVAQILDPNPSHRYPPPSATGVPICSTANFVGDDKYDLSKSHLVPNAVYDEQNRRCLFEEHDVVFARKGRLGFARPYGSSRKVFSHTVVLLKPQPHYFPRFLLWVMRSSILMQDIERRMNTNSGVPTLGVGFIAKTPVPVPPIMEQRDISEVVDSAQKTVNRAVTKLAALQQTKAGLLQDLLTGRVRVSV